MKKVRIILFFLLLVGIALQFVRPSLDNPPVTGDIQAPPEVSAILQRACYDCHSNQTRLKWFDQPAPAYWLVVKDVRDGRRVLNFSNWDSLSKAQQAAKLFESVMQIEQGAMPLSSYTFLHHGGILSADEIGILKRYVGGFAYRPVADTARAGALQRQIDELARSRFTIAGPSSIALPAAEYNGIDYDSLAGWPGWEAVSTTERYDNGTFRVIFGNDIVVKAIRNGRTNPYPDGAVFAKAAWDQLPDTSGEIHAGAFKQVEFMIRDSKKYRSTLGWGFARWVGGLHLKPYGKDAAFAAECVNCHRPLDKTDHTFTFPLTDTAPRGRIVTTFADPRTHTMSALYENKEAFSAAMDYKLYDPGSVLTLVTWSQREDPHWFGGRIPKAVQSVEIVTYGPGGKQGYDYLEGPGLVRKVLPVDSVTRRVNYIAAKNFSTLPFP